MQVFVYRAEKERDHWWCAGPDWVSARPVPDFNSAIRAIANTIDDIAEDSEGIAYLQAGVNSLGLLSVAIETTKTTPVTGEKLKEQWLVTTNSL